LRRFEYDKINTLDAKHLKLQVAGAGFEGPLWSAENYKNIRNSDKICPQTDRQTDREQRIQKLRPLYSYVDSRGSGPIL